jgi:hypothetical protein
LIFYCLRINNSIYLNYLIDLSMKYVSYILFLIDAGVRATPHSHIVISGLVLLALSLLHTSSFHGEAEYPSRNMRARTKEGIILRAEPGKQPLQGIKTVAGNMLRLKGCVRTEIHAMENDASMSTCSPVEVLLR